MSGWVDGIDSKAAVTRIRSHVVQTPLILCQSLSEKLGVQIYLKCENLQHINAFKIRGAENFMSHMGAEELSRGVVAFSSGNHAQGVALAAARRKIPATIVMPKDAPAVKIKRTRELGATVVLYDRLRESREAIATKIAEEKKSTLIPAFDHPWIIEGQGTLGVELLEQLPQIGTIIIP
ncbi:MAG: pyridoxal-phosphate dependent enzyme, partial [Bdellovibrionales bacterium]|nr:pyridoxal-phosphate dependent enzyme [Bdellovibrionales bacterium]